MWVLEAKRPVLQTPDSTLSLEGREGGRAPVTYLLLSCLADAGVSRFIWAPGGGRWPKLPPFFAQQVSGWGVCPR